MVKGVIIKTMQRVFLLFVFLYAYAQPNLKRSESSIMMLHWKSGTLSSSLTPAALVLDFSTDEHLTFWTNTIGRLNFSIINILSRYALLTLCTKVCVLVAMDSCVRCFSCEPVMDINEHCIKSLIGAALKWATTSLQGRNWELASLPMWRSWTIIRAFQKLYAMIPTSIIWIISLEELECSLDFLKLFPSWLLC